MKRVGILLLTLFAIGMASAGLGLPVGASSVSAKALASSQRTKIQKNQNITKNTGYSKNLPSVDRFYSLTADFRAYYDSMLVRWDDIYLPTAPEWIHINADYYKLAMPATYYKKPIRQATSIKGWKPADKYLDKKSDPVMDSLYQIPRLTHTADVDRAINKQLLSFYTQYPNLVLKHEDSFKALEPLADSMRPKRRKKEKVTELLDTSVRISQVSEKDLYVFRPNFWSIGGSGYIQGSQNYISDNWYKGGESTVALISGMTWQFNYNDKQKLQFENKVEWKLGFVTAPSDTVHQYKTNDDLFRISSKLGYQAINNWYYTLSAEFKTQFFSKYETNSDNLISSIFSPAELNVGLGMDYKYKKDGVCNLSVLINPLNYTLYSVASDRVDPTKFNIKEGKKVQSQWGSRLEATLKWSIISNLMWESRLSYTTSYDKVLSEWENTFTFSFNKYFSTKLFVHARFDDSVSREEDESYFQLQELLSLGFNYAW